MEYKIKNNPDYIELWRWNEILKSERKGEINLRFLIDVENPESVELTPALIQELESAYFDVLCNFGSLDLRVANIWIRYNLELQLYRFEVENNEIRKLLKEKTKDVSAKLDKAYKLFNEYVSLLLEKYNSFEVKEYYFDDLPEFYAPIKDVKFYHKNEFEFFLKINNIELQFNENFFKKHLKTRILTLDNIKDLDIYLKDIFLKYDSFENYQFIRADVFDYRNINMISSKTNEYTFVDELIFLQKNTGIPLNLKTNYLSEYLSVVRLNNILTSKKPEHGKD